MSVPARLWIGPAQELAKKATTFLRQQYCKDEGCGSCITCKQIVQKQYYAVLEIIPENYYTTAHVQEIFERISFAAQPGEQFYFVLHQADFLNTATANRLLKIVEEPPA